MSVNAISAQGSKVYIGSGTSGAKTITAITKAFHGEATSTSHGLTKGDRITFASIAGMTELNGLSATIIDSATNTFVFDIDTRALTTYTSGGTATAVTYTQIKEAKDFKPGGSTVSDIDVTDLDSTAKEYRPGLVNNNDFSLAINYLSTDPGQIACKAAFEASLVKAFKVTDPASKTYSFQGYIGSFPEIPSGAVDGVLLGDIKIKISGAVTVS